jgi:hypothetical protein
MTSAHDTIDAAIREVESLRKNLKKSDTKQVGSQYERDLAKATALAWFNNHLPSLKRAVGSGPCDNISTAYHDLLAFTDKSTTRSKYNDILKSIKKYLSVLRTYAVDNLETIQLNSSSDAPPDFSPLIGDPKMQIILAERWIECVACINAEAPLAATVMMGGLLETLMLARFNHEADKISIFAASTAPKDRNTGKTLQLKEWTLRHYLDVSHEMGWISRSTKDVGEVVRDFRNYIHPYKQVSHNITLSLDDARLFWEISKEISRQLLVEAAGKA